MLTLKTQKIHNTLMKQDTFLFGTRLRLLTRRVKEAIHIRLHPITSIGITVHNITAGQQQRELKRKQHVLVGKIMRSETHE